MRVFAILSCAVMMPMMANAFGGNRGYRTYGPDKVRDGYCPRILSEEGFSIVRGTIHSSCQKDNHCESTKKCCEGTAGISMCQDAVPGLRRAGECPMFWDVPVAGYPTIIHNITEINEINECEIDTDCPNSTKCCDSLYTQIRKCVEPEGLRKKKNGE